MPSSRRRGFEPSSLQSPSQALDNAQKTRGQLLLAGFPCRGLISGPEPCTARLLSPILNVPPVPTACAVRASLVQQPICCHGREILRWLGLLQVNQPAAALLLKPS